MDAIQIECLAEGFPKTCFLRSNEKIKSLIFRQN